MPSRLGQVADLGNEPLTSDDEEASLEDVWIPQGVAKLRLGSREISISPWKKLKCLKLTSYSKDHTFTFWEGKVDGLLWRVFCLCQKGWRVSKCFLLRMRKPRITFFCFFQSQKEEIEGDTPKQKLKTIEVVFIYSKRSTGFWYCEGCQSPEGTSGTRTVIKTCSVFSFFEYFSKEKCFREGLVELLLWKIQRSFP